MVTPSSFTSGPGRASWACAAVAAGAILLSPAETSSAAGGVDERAAFTWTAPSDTLERIPGPDPQRPLQALSLDRWAEEDGLPQNFVGSLAQTPEGFLWAGTERGLVRFDGLDFTVYTATDTEGLPTSWITALRTDSSGALWLGTGSGELVRHRNGVFETVVDEGLGPGPVGAIEEGRDGGLWVITGSNGLVEVDPADGSVRRYTEQDGLSSDAVSTMTMDPDGNVWVAGPAGVDRVNPTSGGVDTRVVELPDGVTAGALLVDDDGTVWIGTMGDGLHRALPGEGRAQAVSVHERLEQGFVSVLLRDAQGALWIGTDGAGLFRLWEGRVERAPSRPDVPTHLVQDLLEDQEGNVWMGLTGVGLARFRETLFHQYGMPEGLAMDVALGVREMGDGSVWVTSPGQGVSRITDEGVDTFHTAHGLGSDFAMSVAEGPEGDVWVGTIGGGVSRISGGEVRTFGQEDGLAADEVSVVEWDREGRLWIGFQGAGLQVWDVGPDGIPRGGSSLGPAELPNPVITTVWEDATGGLWVGTRDGVARVETPEGGAPHEPAVVSTHGVEDGLPHGLITGLYGDDDGGLWVSTMGGLARLRDGEIHAFGEEAGLPEMEPMGVVEDAHGHLWMGTGDGVVRVPRRGLDTVAEGGAADVETERFGRPEGLRSGEANGAVHPAAWRAEDGSVLIPTMGGVVRADPDLRRQPLVKPRPVLEGPTPDDRRYGVEDPVRLPVGERTVEFRYSAPTFAAPERIRFRYRLEGVDEEWGVPGDRRESRYAELPPGEYTFRVEVSDRQGGWTGNEARLTVDVPPKLHERPFVRAGGVLVLAVLLGLGYRVRMRRVRTREEELLRIAQEKERALNTLREREEELRQAQKMEAVGRLAGGIAHDFNNLLSVVGLNARLALESLGSADPARQEVEEAVRATDRASELTRQLLQFSRRQLHQPGPVDLNEVVADVEQMLRRLIRADIELETDLARDLPPVRADQAGLEQILVNLIVNARDAMPEGGRVAIRTRSGHADPEAETEVLQAPHAILTVEDTGEGMDADTRSRAFEPFFTTKGVGEGSGLGLASVYGIIQQNLGHVDLASAPGRGTAFHIYLPQDPGKGPAARGEDARARQDDAMDASVI